MTELTDRESGRLAQLEAMIASGLTAFVEVGNALLQIRDDRLYRDRFATFEDYCRQQWQMSGRHANRMIEAAGVAENLGPTGPFPDSERSIRPLVSLDPDQQREAWSRAVEAAPNGRPTSVTVREVVREITTERETFRSERDEADPHEGWTTERQARERAEQSARYWSKVLDDYCQVFKSIRKIGGPERLCETWSADRIEEAADFAETLMQEALTLRDRFRRCADERRQHEKGA